MALTPKYQAAILVILVIILCGIVYVSTRDPIAGTWVAPTDFVSKMGFIVDPKSPSRIRIGATFSGRTMIVMIHSHATVILQKYNFDRMGESVKISYDKTVSESPKKIGPLFEDGEYTINIDGKSLIIYDTRRIILHLRQI